MLGICLFLLLLPLGSRRALGQDDLTQSVSVLSTRVAATASSPEGTAEATLLPGPYKITTALGATHCMDAYRALATNGNPVEMYTCSGNKAQSWTLTPITSSSGNGYQIVLTALGTCVDIANASTTSGALVEEWSCLGAKQTSQIWQFYPFGNYVELVSLKSGMCLTVPGSNTANVTQLQQSACGKGKNQDQLWDLTSLVVSPKPQITASVSALSFGSISVGSSKALTATLTSSGTSPLTISSWTIAGTGYTLASSAAAPLTLNPGGTVTLTVTYKPTVAGTSTGSVTIHSNSTTASSTVVSLSGTGAATQHSVELTWSAPAKSPDAVAGYRIYRAATGGTLTAQNYTLTTVASYVDSTVANATSYEYVVKSVDSSGVESVNSNTFNITIPSK